jgi:hypothetical protein
MNFPEGELGSFSDIRDTRTVDGYEVTGVEPGTVARIKEEDQDRMTIEEIKIEPKVSCVHVVSVKHLSCTLNPALPILCETNV